LYWKTLMYFTLIGNIVQTFGIFMTIQVHFVFILFVFPVLVSHSMKNLATLLRRKLRAGTDVRW
jgi:hypothetical protein